MAGDGEAGARKAKPPAEARDEPAPPAPAARPAAGEAKRLFGCRRFD